jgi:hypothetical protein
MKWVVNPMESGSETPEWCLLNDCTQFHGICIVNACLTRCPNEVPDPCVAWL